MFLNLFLMVCFVLGLQDFINLLSTERSVPDRKWRLVLRSVYLVGIGIASVGILLLPQPSLLQGLVIVAGLLMLATSSLIGLARRQFHVATAAS